MRLRDFTTKVGLAAAMSSRVRALINDDSGRFTKWPRRLRTRRTAELVALRVCEQCTVWMGRSESAHSRSQFALQQCSHRMIATACGVRGRGQACRALLRNELGVLAVEVLQQVVHIDGVTARSGLVEAVRGARARV